VPCEVGFNEIRLGSIALADMVVVNVGDWMRIGQSVARCVEKCPIQLVVF
jgi:hypothetical protein